MVTKGRRITRGTTEQQTGPSLFDDEDQADLRRGLTGTHYVRNTSRGAWTACGVSSAAVPGWNNTGAMPRTLTFSEAMTTCPDCRTSLGRS